MFFSDNKKQINRWQRICPAGEAEAFHRRRSCSVTNVVFLSFVCCLDIYRHQTLRGQHASDGVFTRSPLGRHDFHSEMNRKFIPRLHKTAFMQSIDLYGNE